MNNGRAYDATLIHGRAICKKHFRRFRWGQIVNFEAKIDEDSLITILIRNPDSAHEWWLRIELADFVRVFVVEEGTQCSWPETGDIQRGMLLKSSLGMWRGL